MPRVLTVLSFWWPSDQTHQDLIQPWLVEARLLWYILLLGALESNKQCQYEVQVGAAQDMAEILDFVAAKERKEKRSWRILWEEANCAEERRRRARVGANQDMTAEPSVWGAQFVRVNTSKTLPRGFPAKENARFVFFSAQTRVHSTCSTFPLSSSPVLSSSWWNLIPRWAAPRRIQWCPWRYWVQSFGGPNISLRGVLGPSDSEPNDLYPPQIYPKYEVWR